METCPPTAALPWTIMSHYFFVSCLISLGERGGESIKLTATLMEVWGWWEGSTTQRVICDWLWMWSLSEFTDPETGHPLGLTFRWFAAYVTASRCLRPSHLLPIRSLLCLSPAGNVETFQQCSRHKREHASISAQYMRKPMLQVSEGETHDLINGSGKVFHMERN